MKFILLLIALFFLADQKCRKPKFCGFVTPLTGESHDRSKVSSSSGCSMMCHTLLFLPFTCGVGWQSSCSLCMICDSIGSLVHRVCHMRHVPERLMCSHTQFSFIHRFSLQAVVLEGKYWRRRLVAVSSEYKRWRVFYKQRVWRITGGFSLINAHPA